jgi:hypothetical protein
MWRKLAALTISLEGSLLWLIGSRPGAATGTEVPFQISYAGSRSRQIDALCVCIHCNM